MLSGITLETLAQLQPPEPDPADVLPDNGCTVHVPGRLRRIRVADTCLRCPLARCRYEAGGREALDAWVRQQGHQEAQEAWRLVQAGLTVAQAAERLHVSERTAHRWIRRAKATR